MFDNYSTPSTFEGSATDHLKEEMQRIQDKMKELVGEKLCSVSFWISADAYRDDCLEGSFQLVVRVYREDDDSVKYNHTGPTLDDVLAHVVRHIEADLYQPDIASGKFSIPKLIAAQ
tara:strand:- start:200 stop:550 length:351 start_codon:yes stop_codon:yes gene_type:complete